ncbi:hypothetical protein BASA81_017832 [Batrachochytrium salamandrivorans]|nr:hypothetical protein BASA81_017832 [Batrachochytrium salamandrivorans]
MSNLKEIVASLTDRLRSLELENQTLQQVNHSSNSVNPRLPCRTSFDGSRRHFRGFINQLELVFQLQDQRHDTDRKKIAHSWNTANGQSSGLVQFYSGLSSEIKDPLVHCETSLSLSAAMDQAIRIDNRIFERRQEQQYVPRPFRRNPPLSHLVPRTNISQYPPGGRGPLTTRRKGKRRNDPKALFVCGQSGHLKATCPKSNSRFESQRHVQAIEMDDSNIEMSGNDLGRL